MSINPTTAPLPAEIFEPLLSESAAKAAKDFTEGEGKGDAALLRYLKVGKSRESTVPKELYTCVGDLHVIVNTLRDYANLLERVVHEWGLTGYHAALYELHAERCRKIADKFSAGIDYNYDGAVKHCEKRKWKKGPEGDTGMDGLEATVSRRRDGC